MLVIKITSTLLVIFKLCRVLAICFSYLLPLTNVSQLTSLEGIANCVKTTPLSSVTGISLRRLYLLKSTQYVQDASYVKLRELGLSYTIPKKVLDNIFIRGVEKIKIGFSATNLLTFTPYRGYDPEVSSFGSETAVNSGTDLFQYPSSKRILFNLKVEL